MSQLTNKFKKHPNNPIKEACVANEEFFEKEAITHNTFEHHHHNSSAEKSLTSQRICSSISKMERHDIRCSRFTA